MIGRLCNCSIPRWSECLLAALILEAESDPTTDCSEEILSDELRSPWKVVRGLPICWQREIATEELLDISNATLGSV